MDVYHKKVACDNTKTKHKSTATAVEGDLSRKYLYIMLNFPFPLENMVISNSRNKAKSNLNVMKHNPPEIGTNLTASGLAWRIAVRTENDDSTGGHQKYDLKAELNK